jgi:hypothetical protein
MLSLRTCRTAVAALLPVVLATSATAATAGTTTRGHQQRAHYCKRVDAYRIKTCATALLPAAPLGRQLRWELAHGPCRPLAGTACPLPRPPQEPVRPPASSNERW